MKQKCSDIQDGGFFLKAKSVHASTDPTFFFFLQWKYLGYFPPVFIEIKCNHNTANTGHLLMFCSCVHKEEPSMTCVTLLAAVDS